MLKISIVALFIFLMVGCTTTRDVIVKEPFNVLITPPDEMLEECEVEVPPSYSVYLGSSVEAREGLIFSHSLKQMLNIQNCNNKLIALSDWKAKKIKLFTVKKETEK